jgi:NitT/TauT family transport system substrate-binding protein
MNRRSLLAVAAALPLADAPRAVLAQTAGPLVRVAGAPGDPYEEGYFADELGFFKKAGLNVAFSSLSSGTPIQEGVVAGALDIGIVTPLAVANAVTHGVENVIIAPGGINSAKAPVGYLLVQKNSGIETAQDLAGKPIGLASLKTLHELMVRSWFDESGVPQSKVSLLQIPFPEMGAALQRGTVAAAVQTQPVASELVASGQVRIIAAAGTAIAPQILGGSWFCMRSYAQKNADVVRRFASMMTEVARWANAHKDEASDIEAKVGKMNPEEVRGMPRVTYGETIEVGQIQPILDAAYKFKTLSRPVQASQLLL